MQPELSHIARQRASLGSGHRDITAAALRASSPQAGLRWLDVGCGKGEFLRAVLDSHEPAQLVGSDLIDWLAPDLRDHVDLRIAPAEETAVLPGGFDRVVALETIEHVYTPWSFLRTLANAVAPGGRLVVTTPNIVNLRHRLELLVRGQLTSFRPDNEPHLTPVLPHVAVRVLADEGFRTTISYAVNDVLPLTGGRCWPQWVRPSRFTCVSLVLAARREE